MPDVTKLSLRKPVFLQLILRAMTSVETKYSHNISSSTELELHYAAIKGSDKARLAETHTCKLKTKSVTCSLKTNLRHDYSLRNNLLYLPGLSS